MIECNLDAMYTVWENCDIKEQGQLSPRNLRLVK